MGSVLLYRELSTRVRPDIRDILKNQASKEWLLGDAKNLFIEICYYFLLLLFTVNSFYDNKLF